jgi:hypothetical protein
MVFGRALAFVNGPSPSAQPSLNSTLPRPIHQDFVGFKPSYFNFQGALPRFRRSGHWHLAHTQWPATVTSAAEGALRR